MNKLSVGLKKRESLSEKTVNEMWSLYKEDHLYVSRSEFIIGLTKVNYVFVGRDISSGELGGFCTLSIHEVRQESKRAMIICPGGVTLHQKYYTSLSLTISFYQFILFKKLSSPFRYLLYSPYEYKGGSDISCLEKISFKNILFSLKSLLIPTQSKPKVLKLFGFKTGKL